MPYLRHVIWSVLQKLLAGHYNEAVDEALCFGWIDSVVRKGDADYFYQFFTRRNPRSNWSGVNKANVDKLLEAGKITDAGMVMVDLAQQTGTWTALDEVENLICPPDLAEAFEGNPLAKDYFGAFPKSAKRAILEWLLNAKTPATRARRIHEIVTLAE